MSVPNGNVLLHFTVRSFAAMLVGRIVNYKEAGMVFRGEEKGMFQYGGSTIVLLVKKDRVKIRQDVLERSRHGIETPVRMGEVIGHA